ncbi:MAG: ferrochelatase [Propionibacteriaceae bacterium]|nr:ferrochelatase [Propionibacteriaceae bacterium]
MTDIDGLANADALMVIGFGGPESPDEVIPFLQSVTAGRGIPEERLAEVGEHYFHFGGKSPVNEQNLALTLALADRLKKLGFDLPVVRANRNSAPFIPDVLHQLADQGAKKVMGVALASFSSYSSCRQYREDLGKAVQSLDDPSIEVVKLPGLCRVPGLEDAFVEGLTPALAQVADESTVVMFAVHSLPTAMAATSGPQGNAYVGQHRDLAQRIIDRAWKDAGLDQCPPWEIVFQSRSGPAHIPWLEPDISDAILEAHKQGITHVICVPLSFLTDHMEVIWDLDTQAAETADDLGLDFTRVPTPGTNPLFLDSFAGWVARYLSESLRPPGSGESCFGDCCPAPMGKTSPVVEGVVRS